VGLNSLWCTVSFQWKILDHEPVFGINFAIFVECSQLDSLIISIWTFQIEEASIFDFLGLTEDGCCTNVAEGYFSQCLIWSWHRGCIPFHSLHLIRRINVKNGAKNYGNNDEHVHDLFQDIEVGVDSVTKHQERFCLDLKLTLWLLDMKLFIQSLLEALLKVRLWLLSAFPKDS